MRLVGVVAFGLSEEPCIQFAGVNFFAGIQSSSEIKFVVFKVNLEPLLPMTVLKISFRSFFT